MHIGIDFGSKLAGTTALCIGEAGEQLQVSSSEKGQDADLFLMAALEGKAPATLCIDAPLSLPLAYRQPNENSDFFYRKADRQAKAMSPLFLGGLTAEPADWPSSGQSKDLLFSRATRVVL